MTEAIAKKDYHLADRLNKQIADIHLNQVLKSAEKKDEKMAKKDMKDIHFKKLFEEGLKF